MYAKIFYSAINSQYLSYIFILIIFMTDPEEQQNTKQATNFAKYTGIAFQMLGTIGVFAFIGHQIDAHRKSEKPIFTALLGLLGVVVSLFQVVRSLTKKNK